MAACGALGVSALLLFWSEADCKEHELPGWRVVGERTVEGVLFVHLARE